MNIDYNFRLVFENKITHYVWIYNTNLGEGWKRFDIIRQGFFTALCSQNNVRSATWRLISATVVLFVTFCICFKKALWTSIRESWSVAATLLMDKSGYWISRRCLNVSLCHFIATFVDFLTNQSYFVFISNFLYA